MHNLKLTKFQKSLLVAYHLLDSSRFDDTCKSCLIWKVQTTHMAAVPAVETALRTLGYLQS